MPICNYEGDVIGVAQIINKTNGSNEFTNRDVEVFQRWGMTAKDIFRKFIGIIACNNQTLKQALGYSYIN